MSATQRRLVTPPARSIEPLLVGVREAATLLGLGRDATYQLIRDGRLRSVSVGRKRLIPRQECQSFIEREAGRDSRP
jgi:excisionase family DNA binding protein